MSSRASLNHIYRSVWNQALGVMVAVAEIASVGSGAASCANAQTLPTGGVAVHGSASFSNPANNKLVVTTQNGAGSSHSAINWNTFSIGAGATTQFVQPSAASMSINRVVTNTPSQLFGTLSSNGQIVLVNQSGIAVGAGAVVDTAGFTGPGGECGYRTEIFANLNNVYQHFEYMTRVVKYNNDTNKTGWSVNSVRTCFEY